jgi:vacuolar-type H+-ATPase subunit E/Vma4
MKVRLRMLIVCLSCVTFLSLNAGKKGHRKRSLYLTVTADQLEKEVQKSSEIKGQKVVLVDQSKQQEEKKEKVVAVKKEDGKRRDRWISKEDTEKKGWGSKVFSWFSPEKDKAEGGHSLFAFNKKTKKKEPEKRSRWQTEPKKKGYFDFLRSKKIAKSEAKPTSLGDYLQDKRAKASQILGDAEEKARQSYEQAEKVAQSLAENLDAKAEEIHRTAEQTAEKMQKQIEEQIKKDIETKMHVLETSTQAYMREAAQEAEVQARRVMSDAEVRALQLYFESKYKKVAEAKSPQIPAGMHVPAPALHVAPKGALQEELKEEEESGFVSSRDAQEIPDIVVGLEKGEDLAEWKSRAQKRFDGNIKYLSKIVQVDKDGSELLRMLNMKKMAFDETVSGTKAVGGSGYHKATEEQKKMAIIISAQKRADDALHDAFESMAIPDRMKERCRLFVLFELNSIIQTKKLVEQGLTDREVNRVVSRAVKQIRRRVKAFPREVRVELDKERDVIDEQLKKVQVELKKQKEALQEEEKKAQDLVHKIKKEKKAKEEALKKAVEAKEKALAEAKGKAEKEKEAALQKAKGLAEDAKKEALKEEKDKAEKEKEAALQKAKKAQEEALKEEAKKAEKAKENAVEEAKESTEKAWKVKVKEKEKTVDSLEEKLRAEKKRLLNEKEKQAELEKKHEHLELEHEKTTHALSEAQIQLKKMAMIQEQVKSLRTNLDKQNKHSIDLETHLDQTKRMLYAAKVRRDIAEKLRQSLESKTKESLELMVMIEQMKNDLKVARAEARRAKAVGKLLKEERRELQSQRERNLELELIIQKHQEERGELERSTHTEDEMRAFKDREVDLLGKVEKHRSALSEKEKSFKNLEDEVGFLRGRSDGLEEKVSVYRTVIGGLERRLLEQDAVFNTKITELMDKIAKSDDLKQEQLKNALAVIEKKKRDAEALMAQLQQFRRDLEESTKENLEEDLASQELSSALSFTKVPERQIGGMGGGWLDEDEDFEEVPGSPDEDDEEPVSDEEIDAKLEKMSAKYKAFLESDEEFEDEE